MKNKLRFVLSLLLISTIFTSCVKGNTSQSDVNSNDMASSNGEGMYEIIGEEDLEGLEPIIFEPGDKTKLTYAVPQNYDIPDRLQASINIYLDSIGKSYYVDFKTLSYENYVDEVRAVAKNGDVDILYTGFPWVEGYSLLIEDGTILKLDDYLSSDEGEKLYKSVPDSVWKSLKRDGSIYGACGYPYTQVTPPSYTINKALMEKYNLTADDFRKPLSELEDIFKMVKEGEGKDFYPFVTYISNQIANFEMMSSAFGIKREDNKIELLWEDNTYMDFVKAIFQMSNSEYVNNKEFIEQTYDLDSYLLSFSFTSPIASELPELGGMKTQDRYATYEDVVVITFDEYGWYARRNYAATSICTKTAHQDEVLDLLTTIFTDRILIDYLLYGIEDEDYTIEDGRISRRDYEKEPPLEMNRWLIYGNDFISTPKYFEFEDKEVHYREMCDKLQDSPLMYFEFDEGEYAGEINKSNEAMEIIQTSLEQDLSYDEMLSKLKKAFDKIKTDEIITEMQKQLDSFLEE